ncbi:aldehyde dehydrogenase family protein [Nocardioides pocheonensis]|uniref:Aldehyde dehydrogenase family protein n=1 Tax=Nocardioides pocheonensis TaxID=661485 RepID=A0A3N0GI91_9ACTN|nr:aldehyde dehydrogenase family protein [Nocardioides pocheonensis]RNM12169.1 aldehyde dehydrogenase family protein [Nocardioides pocheonensis]
MTDDSPLPRFGYLSADGHVRPNRGEWFPVYNPATGTVIASAYEVGESEIDLVVGQAQAAFADTWRYVTPEKRGQLLSAWADALVDHRDELAELEVSEVGLLRSEVLGDIDASVRTLRYYAGLADKIEGKTYSNRRDRLAYGVREPYGVVAGVNPYNGTPNFVVMKAAPAIIAGNCIVLKAPEIAPLYTFKVVELAVAAGIPAGVVNVVTGRGSVVGPILTEHPGIGMIAFTGSESAGRSIIRSSAANIVPVILELGGKSPAILLPDADLATAVPSVLHSNFVKSGQSCVAGSRVLVHQSIYDEVCSDVSKRAAAIRVGLPTAASSQMGTLISQQHRSRVDALVHRAVEAGAECLAGGGPADGAELSSGAFYRPTVLAGVEDDNPVATAEVFGPVASLMPFSDLEEAVARANGTEFGLSAQVWGNDARAIQHLAKNLDAGTIWVNTYRAFDPTVPFGGAKRSGFGVEYGFAAVEMYTRHKGIVWDLSTEPRMPYLD